VLAITPLKHAAKRKVVRGGACECAAMDANLTKHPSWFDPDAIQRQERISRRKCRRRWRPAEVSPQPAQRPSPKEPFVEIAHEHDGQWRAGELGEKALHLRPALTRAQPEMRRQNAHRTSFRFKNCIDCSPTFPPWHAEIQTGDLLNRKPCEQRVAVMSIRSKQRRPGDRGVAQPLRKLFEHMQRNFGSPLQFLHGNNVGVELAKHSLRAARIATPVAPDAAMNIVGGHHHARGRAGRLATRPRRYHAWNPHGAPADDGLRARRARS